MARVLIIAEHDGQTLNPVTARVVACAAEMVGADLDLVVFAAETQNLAQEAAALTGVGRVLCVPHPANAHPIAALLTPQLLELAADYSHILAPSTTFGKDLMPRLAACLDVPQVTDIMRVESERVFERPIYAGNAIVTVEVPAGIVVGTVRPASFKPAGSDGSAAIEVLNLNTELPGHSRFVALEAGASGDRPDLQSAAIVVSGGRGVGSPERFESIYRLAKRLGAGVGASRAAVDAGFVPNDMQVGQTGKIIAPDLYIAFGISGAIQHLAGIKDAGTIVAVNTDPDAPIFEVADLGLVADLHEVIPELEALLD